MPATVHSLEERVDEIADNVVELKEKIDSGALDFASFKGKLDNTLSFLRWLGVFAASVLLTTIIIGFTLARSEGKIESDLEQQGKQIIKMDGTLEQQEKQVSRIEATLEQQGKQINKIEATLEQQGKRMDEISVQLTEIRTILKNDQKAPK